jgi:hypothetical protein
MFGRPTPGQSRYVETSAGRDIHPVRNVREFQKGRLASLSRMFPPNRGETPCIDSPFKTPGIWQKGADCLFIDSDEATQEQLGFITRVKRHFDWKIQELEHLASETLIKGCR